MKHIPVLLKETLSLLELAPTDIVLDGTIGYGGHATEILKNIPNGRLIGLDQDPVAIDHCKNQFKNQSNVTVIHGNFQNFDTLVPHPESITRVLIDLGISSVHLDSSKRGFSYSKSEPLDMRMNPNSIQTAGSILNTYPEEKLATLFHNYGEFHAPVKLVTNIMAQRKITPFQLTDDFIAIIKKSFFFRNKRSVYLNTCARAFQALRIEVNDELNALKNFLVKITDQLPPNARVLVLSFHSLEDRMVKIHIKENKDTIERIQKKVVQATQAEIRSNSRAKSAKLRGFIKRP